MSALTTVSDRAQITRAARSQAADVASALSRAFFDDPVFRWVIPDDDRRRRTNPVFFDAYSRIFLAYEEVYVAADGSGAALWAPPGQPAVDDADAGTVGRRMADVFGVDAPRMFELVELLDERHPHELHYFLQFLGVVPEQQGRGTGSALLAPVLARCDLDRVPAYLEATNADNRRLYERHGFVVIDEVRPAGGPALACMWREPITV